MLAAACASRVDPRWHRRALADWDAWRPGARVLGFQGPHWDADEHDIGPRSSQPCSSLTHGESAGGAGVSLCRYDKPLSKVCRCCCADHRCALAQRFPLRVSVVVDAILGGVGDVAQGLQTHQVQARDSVVGVSGFEAREGVLSDDEGAGAEGDEAGIEGVDVDVGCEGVVGTAQRFCASHHRPKPPQRGSAPHPHSEKGLPAENLRSAEVQEQPFLKVLRGWALRSSTLTPSGRSLKDDVGSVPAPGWLGLLSAACLRRPRCPSWGDEHPRRTLPPLRSLQFSL